MFLLTQVVAVAQNHYVVTQYNTPDGLPQKTVNDIQQDHKGYVWIATGNGLGRFDGNSFTTFRSHTTDPIDLTNNRINFLREDANGYFWLLNSDNYIYRFNPDNGDFQRIFNKSNSRAQALNVLSNGDVWAHMANGDLYRIYTDQQGGDQTLHFQLIAKNFSTYKKISIDRQGVVWLLTTNALFEYKSQENRLTCHLLKYEHGQFQDMRRFPNCFAIGADNGMFYFYYPASNTYTRHQLPTHSVIRNIKAYSPTKILLATMDDGFLIYDLKTREHTHHNRQTAGLIMNTTKMLYVDPKWNIWITYADNISKVSHLDPVENRITHYTMKDKNGDRVTQCNPIRFFENINSYLMFHSKGNVINYYDPVKDDLCPLILSKNPETISFNEPELVYVDRQKSLWLGKRRQGIIKVSFKRNLFDLQSPNKEDIYAPENELGAVYEDRSHNLWVTNQSGNVMLYDSGERFKGFLTTQGTLSDKPTKLAAVNTILQDKAGDIWLGTAERGLLRVTPQQDRHGETYQMHWYRHDDNDTLSLSSDAVQALHQDKNGRIWVGTIDAGLNCIEPDEEGGMRFVHAGNRLTHYPAAVSHIRCIETDADNNLWIGTTSGVLYGQQKDVTKVDDIWFQHIQRVPGCATCLSSNEVADIHVTKSGETYLATFGGGLCKLTSFNHGTPMFTTYTQKSGLNSDVLKNIREDRNGDLWITTDDGLCRYGLQQRQFEAYDMRFFPSDIQFTDGQGIVRYDGRLAFPTDRGLLTFAPGDIKKETYTPKLVFSSLSIKGERLQADESPILKANLKDSLTLTLQHTENTFTIGFAALDMRFPDKLLYEYKLDGFDDWNLCRQGQHATYTNIPKGEYTFRVRSTNSDGLWVNNERTIHITVKPTFWESGWGVSLLVLLFVAILVGVTYVTWVFYKLRNKVVFERQLSGAKTKFFTDIVHELRTPFTLVIAPLEHILSNYTGKLPAPVSQDLQLIHSNTQRTVKLINQILDFQKIESHKMRLRVQKVNVGPFIQRIVTNFSGLATSQGTSVEVHLPSEEVDLWIDADKMESVLFNLVSNAFKYSPKGKRIDISLSHDDHEVTIAVTDQGYGIPSDKRLSIFSRFENLVYGESPKQASSGIGLAVVKEVVELHHGKIEVESEVNAGTTFFIRLQKGTSHFGKEAEFILDNSSANAPLPDVATSADNDNEPAEPTGGDNAEQECILLVEDNDELRRFLRTILSDRFRVYTAHNGREGYEKAVAVAPDMIVSDVVMPEMDGIALVKQVRANKDTSHIPIILLTSKTAVEHKIEGLQLGIEDYITKPFSADFLRARILNILDLRRRMQETFRSQLMEEKKETGNEDVALAQQELDRLQESDKELIDHAVAFIRANVANAELSVEQIAAELHTSRSCLFKKIKALTGIAPVALIRDIRLKHAIELMADDSISLTQVAYDSGFSDPLYFSKCFKQVYGVPPSEYRKA